MAHLLELEDAFQDGVSDDLRLYHPGDSLIVNGYFMDNSGSPGNVKLKFADEAGNTAFSQVCATITATQVTCQLEQAHSVFGYLTIALVEVNNEA